MSSDLTTDPKVIVALDYSDKEACLDFVSKFTPQDCRLKIGKEMFTLFGPSIVHELQNKGFQIFLDLKFHDIPNTVASAVKAAAHLGVWMVNVHAMGGARMLDAAKGSLAGFSEPPKLIAVTVLTSMSQDDLSEIGVKASLENQTILLAKLAKSRGFDGVVCSALESRMIKSECGPDYTAVTPGIRLVDSDANDQKRIMTPELAVENGSDYLVIGRAITQSSAPKQVLDQINQAIL